MASAVLSQPAGRHGYPPSRHHAGVRLGPLEVGEPAGVPDTPPADLQLEINPKPQGPETDDENSSNDDTTREAKSESPPSPPDQNNLIINYLPSHITEGDLRTLFASHGTLLHVKVVYDRSTGKSMGYGFVKFATNEEAAEAILAVNGMQMAKKRVKVSVARPSSKDIKHSKLYVTNLPDSFSQEDVVQLFKEYGKIIECRTLTDRKTGLSRCTAFVQFDTRREAKSALKCMHGGNLPGGKKPLLVKFAEDHHRRMQRQGQPEPLAPQAFAGGHGGPHSRYVASLRPIKGAPGGHKARGGGGSAAAAIAAAGGGSPSLPYRGGIGSRYHHDIAGMAPAHGGGGGGHGHHMAGGYLTQPMPVPGAGEQGFGGRYSMASHGSNAYGASNAYGMMGLNNALAMLNVGGGGAYSVGSPMMRAQQPPAQAMLPQMGGAAYSPTASGLGYGGGMASGLPGGVAAPMPPLERGANPYALRM